MPQAAPATDASSLGAAVRRLRIQAGIQQSDLAARVGVTKGHLSRFERGERTVSGATYRDIVTALADLAREQAAS